MMLDRIQVDGFIEATMYGEIGLFITSDAKRTNRHRPLLRVLANARHDRLRLSLRANEQGGNFAGVNAQEFHGVAFRVRWAMTSNSGRKYIS